MTLSESCGVLYWHAELIKERERERERERDWEREREGGGGILLTRKYFLNNWFEMALDSLWSRICLIYIFILFF